jgi:hypothetical protein
VAANAAFRTTKLKSFGGWHRACCSGDTADVNVHLSAEFLPWHRLIVHLYERCLQSNGLKRPIPYWDWDPAENPIPGVPDAFKNDPALLPDDENGVSQRRVVGVFHKECLHTDGLLLPNDFVTFSCDAPQGPHALIHDWASLQMLDAMKAAFDPIFYAHHAMMDRLWYRWKLKNPSYHLPGGAASNKIYFYDLDGSPKYITWGGLWDETRFGYTYPVSARPYRQELHARGLRWEVPQVPPADYLRFEGIDLSEFHDHAHSHAVQAFEIIAARAGREEPLDCTAIFTPRVSGMHLVNHTAPLPRTWENTSAEFRVAPLDRNMVRTGPPRPVKVERILLMRDRG